MWTKLYLDYALECIYARALPKPRQMTREHKFCLERVQLREKLKIIIIIKKKYTETRVDKESWGGSILDDVVCELGKKKIFS